MRIYGVALIAAVVTAGGTHAAAQQASKRTLPVDVAAIMVQEAVAKCKAEGANVSAKVVDAANVEKAFLRGDGAGGFTVDLAQMKINAVMMTGRASGATPPPAAPKPAAPKQMVLPALLSPSTSGGPAIIGFDFGGGLPIMVGTEMIGVIGVSGAPKAEQDILCAEAAVAKVADRLK